MVFIPSLIFIIAAYYSSIASLSRLSPICCVFLLLYLFSISLFPDFPSASLLSFPLLFSSPPYLLVYALSCHFLFCLALFPILSFPASFSVFRPRFPLLSVSSFFLICDFYAFYILVSFPLLISFRLLALLADPPVSLSFILRFVSSFSLFRFLLLYLFSHSFFFSLDYFHVVLLYY